MEVGIRELKARLSEHVRRAAAGESIVVTDHGRPVAQLIPVDTSIRTLGARHPRDRPVVTLYVDSSALLKRYIAEHDSDVAVDLDA